MRQTWLPVVSLLHFSLVACGSSDGDVTGVTGYGGAGGVGGPGAASGGIPGSGGYVAGTGGVTGASGGSYAGGAGGVVQSATGGAVGQTGGAGGTGTGGGGTVPEGTPCIADPANEGAIVGDSYVTGFGSPALQPALAALDASIGKYPNYAGAGCSMVSGGTCTGLYGNVPQQVDAALSQHPKTKFMIVDGGGNDVLICDVFKYPNCNTLCGKAGSSKEKVCKDIVADAIKGANGVFNKLATSGVRDIVYFFYPHIPDAGGGYNEILDYAAPLVKASCDGATTLTGGKLRCHFIDLVQPFKAKFGDAVPAQFEPLGIHPLQPGVDLMSKLIVDTMKSGCLGQSGGCCYSATQ